MLANAPPAVQPSVPTIRAGASGVLDSARAGSLSDVSSPGGSRLPAASSTAASAAAVSNRGFEQPGSSETSGAALSWDNVAIAAADPFANANAPNRVFRLLAAPAEVLGLKQGQDGALQLADDESAVSHPAAAPVAATRLLQHLAAAAAAPQWPPRSSGIDTPQADAPAADAAAPGGSGGAGSKASSKAAPPQHAALLQTAMAKPGSSTSWSGVTGGEGEPAAMLRQEAEKAAPAAPSTPPRSAERRQRTEAEAAQGGFGSPLPLAPSLYEQPSLQQPGATAATPEAGSGKTVAPQLVAVDEARLARETLLALQVHSTASPVKAFLTNRDADIRNCRLPSLCSKRLCAEASTKVVASARGIADVDQRCCRGAGPPSRCCRAATVASRRRCPHRGRRCCLRWLRRGCCGRRWMPLPLRPPPSATATHLCRYRAHSALYCPAAICTHCVTCGERRAAAAPLPRHGPTLYCKHHAAGNRALNGCSSTS